MSFNPTTHVVAVIRTANVWSNDRILIVTPAGMGWIASTYVEGTE